MKTYAKAVVAFVVPTATAIGLAVTEGSPGGTAITQAELIAALVAGIVSASTVYATPNEPTYTPEHADTPPTANEF